MPAIVAGAVAPAAPVAVTAKPFVVLVRVFKAAAAVALRLVARPTRVGTVPPVKRKQTHNENVWAGMMNGAARGLVMTVFAAGVTIGVSTDCTSNAGIVMSE